MEGRRCKTDLFREEKTAAAKVPFYFPPPPVYTCSFKANGRGRAGQGKAV